MTHRSNPPSAGIVEQIRNGTAPCWRTAAEMAADEAELWRDRCESLQRDFDASLAHPCHVCGAKP